MIERSAVKVTRAAYHAITPLVVGPEDLVVKILHTAGRFRDKKQRMQDIAYRMRIRLARELGFHGRRFLLECGINHFQRINHLQGSIEPTSELGTQVECHAISALHPVAVHIILRANANKHVDVLSLQPIEHVALDGPVNHGVNEAPGATRHDYGNPLL